MSIHLNPDYTAFKKALDSNIYVDKSSLIEYTNNVLSTNNNCICVSRPRRFGKSTDANMLVAYYSKGWDASSLFDALNISHHSSYNIHLNQHNVIHLDIQKFFSHTKEIKKMIALLERRVIHELKMAYPEVQLLDDDHLSLTLEDIYSQTKEKFIFIINE